MFTWQTKALIGLSLALGIFFAGFGVRGKFCDAAAAKEQVRLLSEQIAAAKQEIQRHKANTEDALQRSRSLEQREAELNEKVETYERELAQRPKDGACRVTPADRDRLRKIR